MAEAFLKLSASDRRDALGVAATAAPWETPIETRLRSDGRMRYALQRQTAPTQHKNAPELDLGSISFIG